ncbi:pfkB family carbohydrate kinase [Micromonospora coriariae]|uniref:PfkB family carbohydrate kinase n=1 Tax=Micromonospora coriariae TaxID=285665 RepID=A0A1C4U6V3_9ACTN|nr:hypothetical protein [Micromonospora coriariae]SCE67448.1 pfkB family carbohydrate kinase [Micromonospora coriariae]
MLDVLTIGRVGVDIYPLRIATPLAEVETFGKLLSGSPTNVAVAANRQELRAGVITRTGADAFGGFPPDDFPLWFYRTRPHPTFRSGPRSSTSTRSQPPESSGSLAPACASSRDATPAPPRWPPVTGANTPCST